MNIENNQIDNALQTLGIAEVSFIILLSFALDVVCQVLICLLSGLITIYEENKRPIKTLTVHNKHNIVHCVRSSLDSNKQYEDVATNLHNNPNTII